MDFNESVVFEDEFDSFLPQDQEVSPLGCDLLKTIIIPAFASQIKDCASPDGKKLLDQMVILLKEFARIEPVCGEQACRIMLEALFGSTRESLKEFVASISQKPVNPSHIDNEGDLYEFDEIDEQKLDFYSIKQEEAQYLITSKHQEYRSAIGECLLNRWIQRNAV